jgi:hypothetical protein
MPSEFPGSPKLLKGALVVYATKVPVPNSIVVFQYNPDTMSRSFFEEGSGEDPRLPGGDPTAVLGPPVEMLDVTVELDAADQLETGDRLTRDLGIHPALAALELLLYPPSSALILKKALALVGSSAISPAQAALVLFVWGPARVVPVRVTAVSITEEAFDQLLNPIRARVGLTMRTLTERELARAGAPFDTLALVQQISKEALARLNLVNSSNQVAGMLPF